MYIKATYALNIFVAYHSKDQERFEEFWKQLEHLNPLNKGYSLRKIWYDGTNLSPQNRLEIKYLTEGADIVLLLLSDNSIISPLIQSQPIKELLQQHHDGLSIVLPIILNTCWWEDTIFKDLEVLPRTGLPLYEADNIKEELYKQVLNSIQQKIMLVRQQKQALEEAFDKKVIEAEAIYDCWEQNPAQLRHALPLYETALNYWRTGFAPDYKIIEARISICQREINFRHYAKAAQDAYKLRDYQTCFFNCKDALNLRNDAVIQRLYQKVSTHLDKKKWESTFIPFEEQLQTAHAHFLNFDWVMAQKCFKKAIALHQKGFEPSISDLNHKITICQREHLMKSALQKAKEKQQVQDYSRMADILLDGIQQINHEALYQMEYALKLLSDLEQVAAFMDEKTKKWGYLHQGEQRVLIPAKYNAAYEFTENLAGVKKWERWGFIDIEGNEIIPFQYEYVTHFQNGVAQVIDTKSTEPYCINHRGERVSTEVLEVEVPINVPNEMVEKFFLNKGKS